MPGNCRRILEFILSVCGRGKAEIPTKDFVAVTGIKAPNVVRAVKKLQEAGIIQKTVSGHKIFYSVNAVSLWAPVSQPLRGPVLSPPKEPAQPKPKRKFVPPTLQEVRQYTMERQSPVDPKDFFEYFETGNWYDSKGDPVKNWKQKLITWEKFKVEQKREVEGGSRF